MARDGEHGRAGTFFLCPLGSRVTGKCFAGTSEDIDAGHRKSLGQLKRAW